MKILILDDDTTRHSLFLKNFKIHDLTIVDNVLDAIDNLKKHTFDAIFLDHDLGGHSYVESGGDEPTGYDVAEWLTKNPDRSPPNVYVHSMNPVGAQNIKNLLPNATMAPGLWTFKQD